MAFGFELAGAFFQAVEVPVEFVPSLEMWFFRGIGGFLQRDAFFEGYSKASLGRLVMAAAAVIEGVEDISLFPGGFGFGPYFLEGFHPIECGGVEAGEAGKADFIRVFVTGSVPGYVIGKIGAGSGEFPKYGDGFEE